MAGSAGQWRYINNEFNHTFCLLCWKDSKVLEDLKVFVWAVLNCFSFKGKDRTIYAHCLLANSCHDSNSTSRDHQQGWTSPLRNSQHLFVAALILQWSSIRPIFSDTSQCDVQSSFPPQRFSYSNNRIYQIGWFLCAMEEPVPPIVRARFGLEQRCAYRHADLYDEEVPEAPCAQKDTGRAPLMCCASAPALMLMVNSYPIDSNSWQ